MRLKDTLYSFGLGTLYVFLIIDLNEPSSVSFLGVLLIFLSSTLLIMAVLLFKSLWVSLWAFFPLLLEALFLLLYHRSVPSTLFTNELLYSLPVLLILCFSHLKQSFIGRHIPLLIIYYIVFIFVVMDGYLNFIGVNTYSYTMRAITAVIQKLNEASLLSHKITYTPLELSEISFFIPAAAALMLFFILIVNYTLATLLSQRYLLLYRETKRFFLSPDLPNYYIYLVIIVWAITLIYHHYFNFSLHILYIMYNISVILFVPFCIAGLGVLNYLTARKTILMVPAFLFAVLIGGPYTFGVLALLGFLKETNLFRYINLIFKKG